MTEVPKVTVTIVLEMDEGVEDEFLENWNELVCKLIEYAKVTQATITLPPRPAMTVELSHS